MEYKEISRKFAEIYSNLPLKTRREIVVVVNEQPISWEIAHKEIENDTDMGREILNKIHELKIL